MRAGILQLFGQIGVVLKIVFVTGLGIEHISGIANCSLGNAACLFTHKADRLAHAFDPVQRVEYAKHIDAVLPGFLDELLHQVVRVGLVTDGVGAPKQHLQEDIGNRLAHLLQPSPRRLMQKTHGDIKGGAAPHLQ